MSLRSSTIIHITDTELRIKDLEFAIQHVGDDLERKAALREELSEQRQYLRQYQERLHAIDEQWCIQKLSEIEQLRLEAEKADPGLKARLQDLIEDLSKRVQDRKNSLQHV